MGETALMHRIQLALSQAGHTVFRGNVGLFFTKDGNPIKSGLPVGFSDLFGHRGTDAKAFYIEVKTPTGRVRPEQQLFLAAMQRKGAIAGVARSVDEAFALLTADAAVAISEPAMI